MCSPSSTSTSGTTMTTMAEPPVGLPSKSPETQQQQHQSEQDHHVCTSKKTDSSTESSSSLFSVVSTVSSSSLSSSSSSSSDLSSSSRFPRRRGCLRIPSQAESVSREYRPSSGYADVEDDDCDSYETNKKVVTYSDVTIHTHLVILGDNPSTAYGPPLSIQWKAFDSCTLPLEDYEQVKPLPRHQTEMHVPITVREEWLTQLGYARSDIYEVVKENRRIQQERLTSANAAMCSPFSDSDQDEEEDTKSVGQLFKASMKRLFLGASSSRNDERWNAAVLHAKRMIQQKQQQQQPGQGLPAGAPSPTENEAEVPSSSSTVKRGGGPPSSSYNPFKKVFANSSRRGVVRGSTRGKTMGAKCA